MVNAFAISPEDRLGESEARVINSYDLAYQIGVSFSFLAT